MDTVSLAAEGYSPRQIASAKAAQKAMSMLGSPSSATLKLMVRDNLVNNCPVTLDAIRVADHVFEPDVASLQGKMTRRTPGHVDPAYVEIPPKIISRNLNVVVVANLMFINGLPFLVSISRNITLITVSYMPSRKTEDLRQGMQQIISVYQRRGLTVTTAMLDNQFDPLWGLLGTVDLNVTAAAEHAPEIERCIRMIKERIRAQKCRLPYARLPACVLIGLVSFCVFWINAFPHKNSVSQSLSPRTIITGQKLDFRKHCRAKFGAYAQVYQDTTPHNSTDLARAASALVLGPTGNVQGTYKFYNLDTGRQFVANQFTVLPVPQAVIDWVHAIADA